MRNAKVVVDVHTGNLINKKETSIEYALLKIDFYGG